MTLTAEPRADGLSDLFTGYGLNCSPASLGPQSCVLSGVPPGWAVGEREEPEGCVVQVGRGHSRWTKRLTYVFTLEFKAEML